jgi:hypothetical protein
MLTFFLSRRLFHPDDGDVTFLRNTVLTTATRRHIPEDAFLSVTALKASSLTLFISEKTQPFITYVLRAYFIRKGTAPLPAALFCAKHDLT